MRASQLANLPRDHNTVFSNHDIKQISVKPRIVCPVLGFHPLEVKPAVEETSVNVRPGERNVALPS